jgi:hypothetical protein
MCGIRPGPGAGVDAGGGAGMVAPGYGASSGFCGPPGTPGASRFCIHGGSPEMIDGSGTSFRGGRPPIGMLSHSEFFPGGL